MMHINRTSFIAPTFLMIVCLACGKTSTDQSKESAKPKEKVVHYREIVHKIKLEEENVTSAKDKGKNRSFYQ